jgi:hypothetical protein
MRLLLLAQGIDTGGVSARLADAINRRCPDWHVDAVQKRPGPFRYPGLRLWADTDLQALYDQADVVQFQNSMYHYRALDHDQRKPVIVAQQGTYLRDYPVAVNAIAHRIGASISVSTVDLLADAPGSWWAPHVFDLPALADLRRQEYVPGRRRLRIVHSPSNRRVKSTDLVLSALEQLAQRYPIEVDLIENTPWDEAMRRKARADLVIDQLVLGYGLNAIESWAMGIPVICGYMDPDDVARGRAIWGDPGPLRDNTTPDTFVDHLDAYLASATVRQEAADQGLAHVTRWHSEQAVVDYMTDRFKAAAQLPSNGSSALEGWWVPQMQPRASIPDVAPLPYRPANPPHGALPRQRTRRGRAGYSRPVQTYDPAHPGLPLVEV